MSQNREYDAAMADTAALSDDEYGSILEHRERQRLAKEFRLSRTLVATGAIGAACGLIAGGPVGVVVALAMLSTFTAAGLGKRKQAERLQKAAIPPSTRVRVQRILDGLVAESGIEQPTVIISPSKSMNAMALKIFAHRRGTVQVNEGILTLPDPMLRAVLAHELTHYAHRDSRSLVAFAFSRIGISQFQRSMVIYSALAAWGTGVLPWVPGVVGAVAGAVLSPLFIGSIAAGGVIAGMQNVMSRRLERRADAMLPAFTAHSRDGHQDLAAALKVLAQNDFEKAVSRIAIAESQTPLTRGRTASTPKSRLRKLRAELHTSDMACTDRIESYLTANHPPIQDRIARLLSDSSSTRLVPRATVRRVATPSGALPREKYEYSITVYERDSGSLLQSRRPFLRRTKLPQGATAGTPPVAEFRFTASASVRSREMSSGSGHTLG